MNDEGIYYDVPLIVPYHVDAEAHLVWKPWNDGPLLGYELRTTDGETTHLYIDPRTNAIYRGVGMPDVDEVIHDFNL